MDFSLSPASFFFCALHAMSRNPLFSSGFVYAQFSGRPGAWTSRSKWGARFYLSHPVPLSSKSFLLLFFLIILLLLLLHFLLLLFSPVTFLHLVSFPSSFPTSLEILFQSFSDDLSSFAVCLLVLSFLLSFIISWSNLSSTKLILL